MSEDQTITIEVDGQELQAQPGQMLIEVTDAAGINVPRFCYHKHLSVAANCRMCLVEVEKAPKPLPACATPVMDGMKVQTKSKIAREAQKGTMEFLLINHPLDCPICDQGGECELQDVAMGYGGDVSRYSERKRVVRDENLGSLIATDMTRCIHCTRCVRFGGEIAGLRELGATGRGEHLRIGTYIEKSVASELSGNVIDLCPVGALTAKPSRYQARAWELMQHASVAMHDGLGSNIYFHSRRGEVIRAVPRENGSINETWISDRDRFSYQGMKADDRITKPQLRKDGKLRDVDWETALEYAVGALKDGDGDQLGVLVSPNATLEEGYLAQQLAHALGSNNIDHRLRQADFSGDGADPRAAGIADGVASLEQVDAALLIGSWLRKDQPIANHRLRKAALEGASVSALGARSYDFNFELANSIASRPSAMANELAAVAKAAGASVSAAEVSATHQAIADSLKNADSAVVILGAQAFAHPRFAKLRELADALVSATGAKIVYLPSGANTLGLGLAGVLPKGGKNVAEMLTADMGRLLLVGIEPEHDLANPAAAASALQGALVVALASHRSKWLDQHADVILPIGPVCETSGTQINLAGRVQSFAGSVPPMGEARPGWKVLRVLGSMAQLDGFGYVSSEQVRDTALAAIGDTTPDNKLGDASAGSADMSASGIERIGDIPMYSADAIVRRAAALQDTPDGWNGIAAMNPATASASALAAGDRVRVTQNGAAMEVELSVDEGVAEGCIWLPVAVPGAEVFASAYGTVEVERV